MSESPTKTEANNCEATSSSEKDAHHNAKPEIFLQSCNEIKSSLPQDETTLTQLTEVIEHFDQMNLREPLLRGIYGYGIEHPSEIQQRALKPCILGYDVIAQAKSGTGKTIMYIIAILQRLNIDCKACQVLILVPTRERAQGIQRIILTLGEYMNVTCHACIGGTRVREDIKRLETNVQIVDGTTGRIYDMLQKSVFPSENIKMVVLDEADELLSRGFKDQISDIFRILPKNIQIIVTSDTMSSDLIETTAEFMNNPVKIVKKDEERTLNGIRQYYVNVEREEGKLDTLYDLLDTLTITQTIIFCNTCQKTDWLAEKLREHNFTACTMHHNMDTKQREDALREFRTGSSRILIRTETFEGENAIPTVSPIINYDLPTNAESYTHCVGRKGRFGRKSTAITLIINDERQTLKQIQQNCNTEIDELPVDVSNLI